ncbi:hypothetical protein RND81_02G023000 [Saponaria officinalis]|uniref:Uncharacterized protein n=1 Tax=Saponaria officinalis TaxID=3572 RepID=A0AAW1MMN9_SAPOF
MTSPKDVLRSSAVSKQFLSASNSDTVWAKFLWSDYNASRPSSSKPYDEYVSKKDIYLCHYPILLENDTMLCLRQMDPKGKLHASPLFFPHPQRQDPRSATVVRFPECAVMESVCWLEIKGEIQTTLLSPDTTYGAYLVYRITCDSYSSRLGHKPMTVSMLASSDDGLPKDVRPSFNKIKDKLIDYPRFKKKNENINNHHTPETKRCYLQTPDYPSNHVDELLPVVRSDGWMEVEMGRHRVGVKGENQNVVLKMTLEDSAMGHYKTGLVVHGIKVRPLHVTRKQLIYDQLTKLLNSKFGPLN